MRSLEKLNIELNRLFDVFNEKYYNNELMKPVLAVQTNGGSRQKLSMGWCTCNKIWKDHSTNDYYYEITICSEFLYRSVQEICTTLLHEMVHLYCNELKIKDTSRGNTYHNKRFKEIAESHGLVITYDVKIGWSSSRLSPDAEALIEKVADKTAFTVTRVRHTPPPAIKRPEDGQGQEGGETDEGETESGIEGGKPKHSTRKYICPKCSCIIRATKDVNIICGDCKVAFEKE